MPDSSILAVLKNMFWRWLQQWTAHQLLTLKKHEQIGLRQVESLLGLHFTHLVTSPASLLSVWSPVRPTTTCPLKHTWALCVGERRGIEK